VADLFGTGGSPDDLRERTGLEEGQILEALCEARDRGWLADVTVMGRQLPGVPAPVRTPRKRMTLLDRLRGRGTRAEALRNITVLPSTAVPADDTSGWERKCSEFGRAVAPVLLSLLSRAQSAGVAWGKMVAAAIQGIERRSSPPTRDRPLECCATVGGLIGEPRAEATSSVLTARLALAVNGDFKSVHRLDGGVEGFIAPLLGIENEVELMRKRISLFPQYEDVFGGRGRPGVIDALDALVTSCGDAHHRSPFWRVALPQLGISPEELNEITYGNIGGVLLEREDLSEKDRDRIAEINRRWTGITLRHYEQCARRDPGVILLALSHNKVEVVLKCVELGLVTELLIDEDLGMSLWRRADPERAYEHVLEVTAPPLAG
jgi:DNA-binding transcriptional regulator LsrR (DeoR family)